MGLLSTDRSGEFAMADIAASLEVSKSCFFKAFRQQVGETPHRWRLRQRIASAQSDLLGSRITLLDVARKYGFTDQAHFARTFRRIVGDTPSSWRAGMSCTPARRYAEQPEERPQSDGGATTSRTRSSRTSLGGSVPSGPSSRVALALGLLAADRSGDLSIDQVAASVQMSKANFFHAFREQVGRTPHQWRLEQRIAAAQSDLANNSMSLSEIACHYGFSDQAHFTRTFRRVVGETPNSWRVRRQRHGS